jgi:hypothetical protein
MLYRSVSKVKETFLRQQARAEDPVCGVSLSFSKSHIILKIPEMNKNTREASPVAECVM